MKEQFRDRIPRGKIRIKYKDQEGIYNYWETTAEILFSQIDEIVNDYIKMGIKLTNRQLYYQLVGKALIPNANEVYLRLCAFLTQCRYAGMIDWNAIEDKDRVPEKHAEWRSIGSLIKSAERSYRLPRWQDQKYYVELYCEKKAGISVLQPIANAWHVYFGFNKGYSSASAMYDLAKRISWQINLGKKAVILYFGDHDPSGLDMVRDIQQRISEFLLFGNKPVDILGDDNDDPNFRVISVALTMEQIKKYNLPPNPAKVSDPRAKSYIEKYGKISWELDSLNALELRNIAERSVLEYIDINKYKAWVKKEKKEIQALKKFSTTLEST